MAGVGVVNAFGMTLGLFLQPAHAPWKLFVLILRALVVTSGVMGYLKAAASAAELLNLMTWGLGGWICNVSYELYMIFMYFLRFLLIFIDFPSIFTEFHWSFHIYIYFHLLSFDFQRCFIDFIFIDCHGFQWIFINLHWISWIFIVFHELRRFRGQNVCRPVAACGALWQRIGSPLTTFTRCWLAGGS